MQQDIASLNDFDTHLNDKLQFLLDATMGFINIAQNNVMKVMTIASVVGIPPVLVAGIYGMNLKGIVEYDWVYGYPIPEAARIAIGTTAECLSGNASPKQVVFACFDLIVTDAFQAALDTRRP